MKKYFKNLKARFIESIQRYFYAHTTMFLITPEDIEKMSKVIASDYKIYQELKNCELYDLWGLLCEQLEDDVY